jgi:hypothetical protein
MLPGFRFLFAAIALSVSLLVFGLGAAALLRAAHETFASTPSWHTSPETTFAQPSDASRPVLSMLRVDPPVAEKAPDNAPAVTAPPAAVSAPAEPVATSPTPPPEQATTTPPPAEPERIAALQPVDSPAPAAAKPDTSVAENPPQERVAPAQDEPAAQAATPATTDETRVAATTATTEQPPPPPPSEAAPAAQVAAAAEAAPDAPEPVSAPSTADTESFSTTIATLGGPPVNIGSVAKAADPKPDKSATKKHDQTKREHRRRRIAARAQLAQTQAPVDPFGQPAVAPLRVRKPR